MLCVLCCPEHGGGDCGLQGVVSEKHAWHPWYMKGKTVPSGSATTYRWEHNFPHLWHCHVWCVGEACMCVVALMCVFVCFRAAAGAHGQFAFVTIRLAGHEVPHYTPPQAEEMFARFVAGSEW